MTDRVLRLLQRSLLLSMLVLGGVSLLYGASYRLQINGSRGEMRLMLSYLHTLEEAIRLDTGSYAYFDQYYGARIEGHDHCQQPEGAARLGFLIRWCHEEGASPVRYAYKVLPVNESVGQGFQAIAHSGSDATGASFVCFFRDQAEKWVMNEQKELISIQNCL